MIDISHDKSVCALAGSDWHLLAFFEAAYGRLLDGVVLLEPTQTGSRWVVTACNTSFADLYKRPRQSFQGAQVETVVWLRTEQAFDAQFYETIQRQGFIRVECVTAHRDNPPYSLELTLTPLVFYEKQYILGMSRILTKPSVVKTDLDDSVTSSLALIEQRFAQTNIYELESALNDVLGIVAARLSAEYVVVGSNDALHPFTIIASLSPRSCMYAATEYDAFQEWLSECSAESLRKHALGRAVARLGETRIDTYSRRHGAYSWLMVVCHQRAHRGTTMGVIVALPDHDWNDGQLRFACSTVTHLGRAAENLQVVKELRDASTRYELLTSHVTDVISIHDASGVLQYCSPSVRCILGYEPRELIGRSPFEFCHPSDIAVALAKGKVHDSGAITTTYRLRHRDGHYIWAETSARVVSEPASGAIREIVAVTRDVDARKRFEHQIEQLAYFDSLTTLANRRLFYEKAKQVLERPERQQGYTALLYLDLDGFKKVNDSLGHDAGDELLIQVAARLRNQLRDNDTLARLGGDEFAVLLTGVLEENDVVQVAGRLVEGLRAPFTVRGQIIHLGVSIGIACAPRNGRRVEDLLKNADIAMYRAKSEGDGFRFFDPALSSYSQERLQTEADLRLGIPARQLRIEYQPVIDLKRQEIVSVEGLVRWYHPRRGRLMPDQFVPLAEESDLIRELDRAVLAEVMQQLKAWEKQGITIRAAVNLSARTLHDSTFPEYVRSCLYEMKVDPRRLIFEMTESVAMRDIERTCGILQELRDLGTRVALDDFGSGHTSLKHFKRLPIDYVKIDRTFTEGIYRDTRDEGVVRAIVALSEGLGVPVVAEGVSSEAQIAWLRAIGCTMAQGYEIGKPQKPEDIATLLLAET